MRRTEPGWDLYRTFLAVLREGSFSAAAKTLGLAQPTPGRHIEMLEAALRTSLFKRSRRGLVPTRAAMAVMPQAEAMAAAASAVERTCSAEWQQERGVVRITASPLISHEVLPTTLAEFCCRYPHIEIELVVSNRNEDVLRRDVDMAVRMARPTQQALVARRVGSVEIGLFAHRRYLERFGTPRTPADLASHRLIGFDQDGHGIRSAGGAAAELRREHTSDSGATAQLSSFLRCVQAPVLADTTCTSRSMSRISCVCLKGRLNSRGRSGCSCTGIRSRPDASACFSIISHGLSPLS